MRQAFLCEGVRTPVGRYGGSLSSVRPDDLFAHVIKATLAKAPGLDPRAIDEVYAGCANQAGEDNRNVARMAALLAGLPEAVAGVTVNRLCASSLEAVGQAARAIRCGEGEFMLAGGVESMSRAPFVMGKAESAFARTARIEDTTIGWRFVNPEIQRRYGIDSMPETAENVAAEFGVSRADQDAFALRSQQRWAHAHAEEFFKAEILPVSLPQKKGEPISFSADEHPRTTTLEALAKLKPVVKAGGSITAGNASGINDGSCALLLASEAAAGRLGLRARARVLGYAVAGVAPRVMGIGPAPASEKLLARLGLKIRQMDVVELNEAFASQALAVLRKLGLPDDAPQVNPNGGAIAIGHPLGATGARLVLTALSQLERIKGRYALCTMCIGVGQGAALVLERA